MTDIHAAGYEVSIPEFEGPMDLLLHLVTKNRIDIYDIPIHQITDQYLDYLEKAKTFDLNISSHFFAMAATLVLIKSRMILPHWQEMDANESEDPRQELVRSLEEFKVMKELRSRLESLWEEELPYQRREASLPGRTTFEGKISLARLTNAFWAVLDRESVMVTYSVLEPEEVTLECQMESLRSFLCADQWQPLEQFFRRKQSRLELAVSLLALLELVRKGDVILEESGGGWMIRLSSEMRDISK